MHTLPAPPFKGMGEADPYRSLGHPLRAAVLLHRTRVADGDGPELRPLHDRPAVVHAGVLCQLFRADRPFPVRQTSWKFLLCNVVLIAASMGAVHLMFELLPHPEWEHPRPEREWQETVGFFMVNAMLYMLVAGAKRRHQDDRKLVRDGVVPPGVGEKPCRSRIAESEEPVEPPIFSSTH